MTLSRSEKKALRHVRDASRVPRTLAMLEAFASLARRGLIAPEYNSSGSPVAWVLTPEGRKVAA